jgi:CheY-like chemotaxis protein
MKANASMRKPRAIVCNDSEVIQGVFRRILERMGYEVLTVETPITCAFHRGMLMVALSIGGATDILTTYYDMPDMTGMELLDLQHQKRFKLSSKNKTRMTVSEELVPRGRAAAQGCHFFPKVPFIPTLVAWGAIVKEVLICQSLLHQGYSCW